MGEHLFCSQYIPVLSQSPDLTGPHLKFFYIHCSFRLPASRVQVAVISQPFVYNGLIDLNVRATLKVWRGNSPFLAWAWLFSFFKSLILNLGCTEKSPRSIPNNRNPLALPQINEIQISEDGAWNLIFFFLESPRDDSNLQPVLEKSA